MVYCDEGQRGAHTIARLGATGTGGSGRLLRVFRPLQPTATNTCQSHRLTGASADQAHRYGLNTGTTATKHDMQAHIDTPSIYHARVDP